VLALVLVFAKHLKKCFVLFCFFLLLFQLGMTIIYLTMPVFVLGGVTTAPMLLFIGPLLVSVALLANRTATLINHIKLHYNAGVLILLRIYLFFTLPLWFLFFTAIMVLVSSWSGAAVCFLLTSVSAAPVLYAMRPAWAFFGSIVTLQVAAGGILVAGKLTGDTSIPYMSICLLPLFSATCTTIYLRKYLHKLWDVQLKVRPSNDCLEAVAREAVATNPANSVSGAGSEVTGGDGGSVDEPRRRADDSSLQGSIV
jgi:hypothetical protein